MELVLYLKRVGFKGLYQIRIHVSLAPGSITYIGAVAPEWP